jgi:hypothetical protein
MNSLLGYLLATSFVAIASIAPLEEFGQHVAAMYAAINVALQATGATG